MKFQPSLDEWSKSHASGVKNLLSGRSDTLGGPQDVLGGRSGWTSRSLSSMEEVPLSAACHTSSLVIVASSAEFFLKYRTTLRSQSQAKTTHIQSKSPLVIKRLPAAVLGFSTAACMGLGSPDTTASFASGIEEFV